MSKSIEDQLAEILEEYAEEIGDIDEKENKKIAQATMKDLKTTSPKHTGSYANKWTFKKIEGGFIVYNQEGWKTHLLENGHVTANGSRTVGAIKHIKPAEEKGIKQLIDDLKKEIENK